MKHIKIFIVIIIMGLVAMPVFAQRGKKNDSSRGKTTREIRAVADTILDNILEGIKFDEYLKYSKDFEPSLKISGARTKFYRISRYVQNSLGGYVSRAYMGSLEKGEESIILWKGVFGRTKDDVLIKLIIAEKNNRYVVTGLWLQ